MFNIIELNIKTKKKKQKKKFRNRTIHPNEVG